MRHEVKISHGGRGRHAINAYPPDPDTLRGRFEDIKDELRRDVSFEVTNGYVLSVLFDLYWIHAEQEQPGGGLVGPPLAADGGQHIEGEVRGSGQE